MNVTDEMVTAAMDAYAVGLERFPDCMRRALEAALSPVTGAVDDGRSLAHTLASAARSLLSRPPELRGPFKTNEEDLRRIAGLGPRTTQSLSAVDDAAVERVARAMWERLGADCSFDEAKNNNHKQYTWIIEDARAALTSASPASVQRGETVETAKSLDRAILVEKLRGHATFAEGESVSVPVKTILATINALAALSPVTGAVDDAADPTFPDAMKDSDVRIWINACNHEPARQALRQLLAYRVRGVSKSLAECAVERAWNCDKWPDWLHVIVNSTAEVADRTDMSSEQAHGYAVLLYVDKFGSRQTETERLCIALTSITALVSISRSSDVHSRLHAALGTLDEARKIARAALTAASLPSVQGWQTMDSAPKDGTWVIAYRPRKGTWGYMDRLLVVCWSIELGVWVWPDEPFDVYDENLTDRIKAEGRFDSVDLFEDASFTHWMPLPSPPKGGDRP